MTYKLFVFGRLKEAYLRDAVKDYLTRLSHYRNVEIIELPDQKEPKNASPKDLESIKQKEALGFFKQYKEGPIFLFDESGKAMTSTEFSRWLTKVESHHQAPLNFVIGGSNGHAQTLKEKADQLISMSAMTFPHGVFRVIALEQLYRALKIRLNETYHK